MITVVDSPCGNGKTSWAIQYMNENDGRFIFVTPYLDEVSRITAGCKARHFNEPKATRGTKGADLKRLLVKGDNIVSTHELFSRIDHDTIELIRLGGYTLILDEVMGVVQDAPIKNNDVELLRDQGLIDVTEDGTVVALNDEYRGRFEDIMLDARMNRLVYVDGTMLMWQFPVDIFAAFDEVFVLTYLFDGQIQKYYYDFHGIKYRYRGIDRQGERHTLTDVADDRDFRNTLGSLIHLYDGKLNAVGRDRYGLSVSWYKKQSPAMLRKIKNDVYNWFRHVAGGRAVTRMWTCFKDQGKALSGKGYARGWIAHNARATNQYRDRSNLAYLVNRFPRTPIERYFQTRGITIDKDRYALGEIVQWIWRSQVRENRPVNLYVPSSRMRGLIQSWMADAEEHRSAVRADIERSDELLAA